MNVIALERVEFEAVSEAAERLSETVLAERSGVTVLEDGQLEFDTDAAQTAFEGLLAAAGSRLGAASRARIEDVLGEPIERIVSQGVRDWLYPRSASFGLGLIPRNFGPGALFEELSGRLSARGYTLVVKGEAEGRLVRPPRRWSRLPILAALGLSVGYVTGLALGSAFSGQTRELAVHGTAAIGALASAALGLYWTLREAAPRCSECAWMAPADGRNCEVCGALLTRES